MSICGFAQTECIKQGSFHSYKTVVLKLHTLAL